MVFEKARSFRYYGLASISRLLKIIGLFCKRALLKRRYSTKETCNFEEPTNRSHHIRRLGICGSNHDIGLFGRISSLVYGSFAKETYNFKERTFCKRATYHDSICIPSIAHHCCSVLQRVAACGSVLQCVAVCEDETLYV